MQRSAIGAFRAAIALLVAFAVMFAGSPGQAALAAPPTQSQAIATDIAAVFGPSSVTTPPSVDELLLAPDTAGVAPVSQGGLTVWPEVQPGVSYAANGADVPAHYEFTASGDRLIKVVEHHEGMAFPVVGDPI